MTLCKTLERRSKYSRNYNSHLNLTNYRYDFEYEDDDDEQSGDVDVENKYYNAKQLKAEDPETAINEFLGVPALEEEKSDWYDAVWGLLYGRWLMDPQGLQGTEAGNQAGI